MGREVRMVPPDWEHPVRDDGRNGFQPMYDQSFEDACKEWKSGYEEWKHSPQHDCEYWEWDGDPPEQKFYRPAWDEGEATHYQLYETVSEGTPVSPAFPTTEELARYLSENGDYWYQHDVSEGRRTFRTKPTYEQALAMVNCGHSVSMVIANGEVQDAYQQHDHQEPSR